MSEKKRLAWYGLILFALTGCVSQTSRFVVPEQIIFRQTVFEKQTHSQIDEMQQMLYLPKNSSQTPEDWQQGLLVFLDQNSTGKTLQQRLELRKQHFSQQPQTLAEVDIQQHNGSVELQSQVIYPPTERFANIQLEVSRGQDLNCGFGQLQFADKRAVSSQNLPNLTDYQPLLIQLATQFSQLAWQIKCL